MAGYQVPGYSRSEGKMKFTKLSAGTYEIMCKACEVTEPKNPSPIDVWSFTYTILAGPPDADGKSSVNRTAWDKVFILKPEHPSYKPEWDDPHSGQVQMGVDELKSRGLAFGVTARKDVLNPESFVGLKACARLYYELGKDKKEYARWTDFEPVE